MTSSENDVVAWAESPLDEGERSLSLSADWGPAEDWSDWGRATGVRNYHAAMAMTSQIHETAVVEAGSEIGDGTRVWHHAHVRAGASIGAGCVIGKNVYIDEGVRIGTGCKIQNNVSVYNGVTIGNDVFVGPSVTFTNDRIPRAFNSDWTVTPTHVLDGASLGANATIVCGVTIGRFAMVAAGATVTRNVADYQLVAGTPARHLGWVDRDGTVVSREVEAP